MLAIFDKNIEGSDFLEIILTPEEVDRLHMGIAQDFPPVFSGKRNLNIFIRESKNATQER